MHSQLTGEISLVAEEYFFLNFNTLTFCGRPLNFLIQASGLVEASSPALDTLGAMIN